MRSTLRLAGLTLSLGLSTAAGAQVTECTEITVVPHVITAPGVHCLKRSLTGAGSVLIRIASSDVVLDLNGHTLEGPAQGQSFNVASTSGSNVTVRNGTIRGGLVGGVLAGGAGSRVERIHVDRSVGSGIVVTGPRAVVRDNVVSGVGVGGGPAIAVSGAEVRISNNRVIDTVKDSARQAIGISIANAPGAVIDRNFVADSFPSSLANTTGIDVLRTEGPPMRTTVAGNRVVDMTNGIRNASAVSLFLNNAVGGAATPFQGGVMAGTTNFSF